MKRPINLNLPKTLMIIIGLIIGTFILTESRAQELQKSLLWEVKGQGIKTSYVYGTFHLMPQEDFELKEKVTKAFDESDQIVMELDMDDPMMQAELMSNVAMKNGQTIESLLGTEDYNKLNEYLKSRINMSLAQMNSLKPFFILSSVVPSMIEGTPASYEITFLQRAIDQEKTILGLETPSEQAGIFDEIPYEDQAKDLIEMVDMEEEIKALFAKMIDYYKEEDVNEIYNLMVEYMDGEMEERVLITDRNSNWVPKIGNLAKEKSTFFAVGAGHLGGEKGVIQLLRDAGYKVKPVK